MYYAHQKDTWFQVIHHDAPVLAIPGLDPKGTMHRECRDKCPFDKVALDFLPNHETAWAIADRITINGDKELARISNRTRAKIITVR